MRLPVRAAALLLLVLAAVLPAAGQSNGWGVSPGEVDVANAQAGQSYLAKVQLQNEYGTEAHVTVARLGDAGNWTTVDAGDSFTIPASTVRQVTLTVAVPAAQGPGHVDGQLTFYREPDAAPSGSGAAVRQGAGVLLKLDVGGTRVERITWSAPRVEDAAQGAEVHAFATATNAGNVLTTAKLSGEVLPFSGSGTLRNATGSRALRPGEQAEVQVSFAAGLPVGQYRAHLFAGTAGADGSLDATLPFKVAAPGTQPPDGTLRALLHAPRATAGKPVRIDGWFQNLGAQPIQSAVLKLEMRRDGTLVAPLQSDPLAVPAGASVNLTVYWTPPAAGTYMLAGKVLYDGYLTPESQSLLNAEAAPGAAQSLGWWWLVLLAVLVALAVAVWAWRRKQERKRTAKVAPIQPARMTAPAKPPAPAPHLRKAPAPPPAHPPKDPPQDKPAKRAGGTKKPAAKKPKKPSP